MDKIGQHFFYLMMIDELTMAPIYTLQSKLTGKMYEFRYNYHTIGKEVENHLINFANEIIRTERNEKIEKILNG